MQNISNTLFLEAIMFDKQKLSKVKVMCDNKSLSTFSLEIQYLPVRSTNELGIPLASNTNLVLAGLLYVIYL